MNSPKKNITKGYTSVDLNVIIQKSRTRNHDLKGDKMFDLEKSITSRGRDQKEKYNQRMYKKEKHSKGVYFLVIQVLYKKMINDYSPTKQAHLTKSIRR